MHSSPSPIDYLIDDSTLIKSSIDTGCLCHSIFDENHVCKNKL